MWNVPYHKDIWRVKCHDGIIRGLGVRSDGEGFLTCSDDKKIKWWAFENLNADNPNVVSSKEEIEDGERQVLRLHVYIDIMQPQHTWVTKNFFTSLDTQRNSELFATAGVGVQVWDFERQIE